MVNSNTFDAAYPVSSASDSLSVGSVVRKYVYGTLCGPGTAGCSVSLSAWFTSISNFYVAITYDAILLGASKVQNEGPQRDRRARGIIAVRQSSHSVSLTKEQPPENNHMNKSPHQQARHLT